MARQDILIDARYGELETADDVTGRVYCDFRLLEHVDGTDNERYAYGELSVPQALAARWGEGSALYVRIPYTASYRELRLRLCVTAPGGGTEYLVNPADNRSWYTVQLPGSVPVRFSEFGALNAEGSYCLVRRAGVLELYSGASTDLRIGAALRQNEVFLLKAAPGTLYQYPTSGVGLIDFLHGNFENTGLATRLQREFESDRMTINSAYMDSETGELLLDVTEKTN